MTVRVLEGAADHYIDGMSPHSPSIVWGPCLVAPAYRGKKFYYQRIELDEWEVGVRIYYNRSGRPCLWLIGPPREVSIELLKMARTLDQQKNHGDWTRAWWYRKWSNTIENLLLKYGFDPDGLDPIPKELEFPKDYPESEDE